MSAPAERGFAVGGPAFFLFAKQAARLYNKEKRCAVGAERSGNMKKLREAAGRLSIRHKILALTLLGIFGVGVVSFVVSFFTLRTILVQRICETNQSTMETMAGRVDEVFGNSTSAVVGISIDPSIQSHVGDLYSESDLQVINAMNALKTSLSNYTYTVLNTPASIALLTEDGRMIYNGDALRQADQQRLQAVYADYISRFSFDSISGQVPVKEYLHNPLSVAEDDYVYCIAMPMRSADEQRAAIVMMLIRTRYMMPYLTAGDEAWHTRVLTDADDTVVLAEDPALIGRSVKELTGGGRLPASGSYTAAGDGYLFRQKLTHYSGAIYDLMDGAYIQGELWTVARRLLALMLAAAAVMAVIAQLLANSITRPIVRLSEKMAERKYAALASDSNLTGGNEVRVLEYSFDVMQENIRQLMEQNQQKEREKRRTEIKALQSQIRPHFLFNTLNTVRCSIQNNNSEKAQNMILALSGLLRMTLVKGEELIPLREELQTLQYYQDIMTMRTSMHFETFYQVEQGLEGYLLPKLLLQPLVENCILHGFKCRKADGEISIAAVSEADGVHILIVDNGGALAKGADAGSGAAKRKNADSFSGIGLANIDRRIKLYYGEASGVRLYALDETHTAAELHLPPLERGGKKREGEAV